MTPDACLEPEEPVDAFAMPEPVPYPLEDDLAEQEERAIAEEVERRTHHQNSVVNPECVRLERAIAQLHANIRRGYLRITAVTTADLQEAREVLA